MALPAVVVEECAVAEEYAVVAGMRIGSPVAAAAQVEEMLPSSFVDSKREVKK